MKSYYTYILYSPSKNRFYKGSTNDLLTRFERHQSKREKATRSGVPWTLLWYAVKSSRSEALRLEYKLKNLGQTKLIQFMLKYANGVAGPDELLLLQQLSGC